MNASPLSILLCFGHTKQCVDDDMKWLLRLTGRAKAKTPLPPKPYVDLSSTGKHMSDPRFTNTDDLAHVDAEKPHWSDPRFESREKVPFFDGFGFNRNWSWTIFKLMCMILPLMLYYEMRLIRDHTDGVRVTGKEADIRALPSYAVSSTTDEELRSAGFVVIGAKEMDHLASLRKKDSK
ncbi:membrane-associated protein, putative [Bodo saltans]|uniref:Membrane-associated protein, putative n=1 Tax=Bodo saltans TaxID=75058 RepID=A0A0S4J7V8_BODSA|nr:membrane-associated protein, putative [Bodo saltans]|eukprot:CUG86050.1 membrane-associated protein, putative [Bodo saltans]